MGSTISDGFILYCSNPLNRKKLTPSQAESYREEYEKFGAYSAWCYERVCLDDAKYCYMKMMDGSKILVMYFYSEFDATVLCLHDSDESLLMCDSLRRCYDTKGHFIPCEYPLVTIDGHVDPRTLKYHEPIELPKRRPWGKRIRITRDEPENLLVKAGFSRDTVIGEKPPKRGKLRITMLPNPKKKRHEYEMDMTFMDYVQGFGCLILFIALGIGFFWGLIQFANSIA